MLTLVLSMMLAADAPPADASKPFEVPAAKQLEVARLQLKTYEALTKRLQTEAQIAQFREQTLRQLTQDTTTAQEALEQALRLVGLPAACKITEVTPDQKVMCMAAPVPTKK